MAEWLVEKGVGETRAALVEGGAIVEARIELDGTVPAGTVIEARLVDSRKRIACDESGSDYLLHHVPAGISEGATFNLEVTRPAIPGPEPWKRPLGKATRDELRPAFPLRDRLGGGEIVELAIPAANDRLAEDGWDELVEEARSGRVDFDGGSLGIFVTPAMTLVDVDGHLPPAELAIAGAAAAASAIRRLDIGGSIGIDLPTVAGKAGRQAATDAIDSTLPQPFERTAMNGFGFLQIVRPRRRASLVELAHDRAGFEARALLRRAAFDGSGARRLAAHPAVIAAVEANPAWLDALARQLGGAITLRGDGAIPIHGGYAEPS